MELLEICGQKIPVVPQRHARLRHFLKNNDFQKVMSGEYSTETYRILGVLIPALHPAIPIWQWEGFSSEAAYSRYLNGEEDAYEESQDNSPTTAEIVAAFETALMVNGADRLGKLINLVQSGSALAGVQRTDSSPESLGENGASASMTSGAQSQT